jgi:hypothetical protein
MKLLEAKPLGRRVLTGAELEMCFVDAPQHVRARMHRLFNLNLLGDLPWSARELNDEQLYHLRPSQTTRLHVLEMLRRGVWRRKSFERESSWVRASRYDPSRRRPPAQSEAHHTAMEYSERARRSSSSTGNASRSGSHGPASRTLPFSGRWIVVRRGTICFTTESRAAFGRFTRMTKDTFSGTSAGTISFHTRAFRNQDLSPSVVVGL